MIEVRRTAENDSFFVEVVVREGKGETLAKCHMCNCVRGVNVGH